MSTRPKSISDLRPWERNPRTISDSAALGLRASLERFGDISGITYNARTQRLVCGHQRVRQLTELGGTLVDGDDGPRIESPGGGVYPVRVVDWDEVTEAEANVAANNGFIGGEFTGELKLILDEIKEQDPNGFSELRLDSLDTEEQASLDPVDDDDFDSDTEPPAEAITKPGDVWLLGKHRLVCGDSTVADVSLAALGGMEPFIMVTDPPYGVNYDAKWRNDFAKGCKGLRTGLVKNDDKASWGEVYGLFSGRVAYVWHAGLFEKTVVEDIEACQFEIKSQIIWKKQHFVISRGSYHWHHEACVYAVRKGAGSEFCGGRKQSTIWEISNLSLASKQLPENARTNHSTQKPVECMARPIRNHGKRGYVVYDPFGGSGTTIIAAEQTDRVCCMIEIDPRYCDMIIERWETFTGGKAKRLDHGQS